MDVADDRLMLSIPSNPRYLCTLRAFCSSLLEALGFHRTETDRVILAIHEACTNVIEHGYAGDMTQRIDVTVLVTAAGRYHRDSRLWQEARRRGDQAAGLARCPPAGIGDAFYAVNYGRCDIQLI